MKSEMELFLKKLKEEDFHAKTDERDDKYVISVGLGGKNTNFHIHVVFDKDDHSVALRMFDFVHVTDEQKPVALLWCNSINKEKRWFKFYVDDDGDVIVENDMIVDEQTAGEEVFELMIRMAIVADEAYKDINKAIWS